MTPAFATIIAASAAERRDLFVATAGRLGTSEQNIEKDFWVCWVLDALFNGLEPGGPRLLFKGGTSLSKGFGLISRFSEDIDITVFREDIGQPATVAELEALSGKKRAARLDAIREACQAYILGPLRDRLAALIAETLTAAGIAADQAKIEADPQDPDGQSLLFRYPSATDEGAAYIRRAVKIESGAKSALDPHAPIAVKPYVADDLPDLDLTVSGVTTVDPARTFWDKVVILHGLRAWWERRRELRGGGQRVSRHYYDIHCLLHSEIGKRALADRAMAVDCARHARMFFNRPDLDLAHAAPGTFVLTPAGDMGGDLARDYAAMAGMIFGKVPSFDAVISSVAEVEERANAGMAGPT